MPYPLCGCTTRADQGVDWIDYPALVVTDLVAEGSQIGSRMAGASEKGKASGEAKQPEAEPTLEDLLESLNLKGEDIDGFVVPKSEVEALKAGAKWMAASGMEDRRTQ